MKINITKAHGTQNHFLIIQNKENEKRGRVQALESQREVNVGYEAIASGILEVLQI